VTRRTIPVGHRLGMNLPGQEFVQRGHVEAMNGWLKLLPVTSPEAREVLFDQWLPGPANKSRLGRAWLKCPVEVSLLGRCSGSMAFGRRGSAAVVAPL
jgi:hypothetical protein